MLASPEQIAGAQDRLKDLEIWIFIKTNNVGMYVTVGDMEALLKLRRQVGRSWNVNRNEWVDIDAAGYPVE